MYNVLISRRNGKPATADPWKGNSLEWATTSPPPVHNFDSIPRIRSERPAFDLHHPEAAPAGYQRTGLVKAMGPADLGDQALSSTSNTKDH